MKIYVFPFILAFVFSGLTRSEEAWPPFKSAQPDVSRYPQTRWFTSKVAAHASAGFQFFSLDKESRERNPDEGGGRYERKDMLLIITAFYWDDTHSYLNYGVTNKGFEEDYRSVWYSDLDGATQAHSHEQLSAVQLRRLQAAIKSLPDSNAYPTLNNLVIVSFRKGSTWVTRTMSADKLKGIYAIIGERFETKKPK